MDVRHLGNFFESLDILQRLVTRLAATCRSPDALPGLEERMLAFEARGATLDSEKVSEANYEFHVAIDRTAQSAHLGDAYAG